jgi:cytochrome c553
MLHLSLTLALALAVPAAVPATAARKVAPKGAKAADACLTCHGKSSPQVVADWKASRHATMGVGCVDCHGDDHKAATDGKAANDTPCVADWDSVSYTSTTPHCLRRVDTNLHCPADLNGLVHHDGQIWSRALWDIRNALGNVKADTIILEAQFQFAPDTTMPAAAQATVNAAENLYGAAEVNAVLAAFQARGILP